MEEVPYVLGFDTETTGVDDTDRVIEIALIKYDWNGKLLDSFIQRFDPECPISPKAQRVHGISYADLVGQPKFAEHADKIAEIMQGADLLVAHNIAFDTKMLTAEFVRSSARIPQAASFCTMENSRWACFDGKLPKLKELCFALGVEYDEGAAHAASYDVEVMMECFFKGMKREVYEKSIESALEVA